MTVDHGNVRFIASQGVRAWHRRNLQLFPATPPDPVLKACRVAMLLDQTTHYLSTLLLDVHDDAQLREAVSGLVEGLAAVKALEEGYHPGA